MHRRMDNERMKYTHGVITNTPQIDTCINKATIELDLSSAVNRVSTAYNNY